MNKIINLFKETRQGKTIARILFNFKISEKTKNAGGVIVDLGSGFKPSHEKFLEIKPEKLLKVDINEISSPDIVADLNNPLPLPDNFADNVFLFNVIYILKDPGLVLKEIYRILKPGGKLFFTSPFIFNEAREPDDHWRFTSQALEKILTESGFKIFSIDPVGERFSAAIYLISPFLYFWPIKFLFYWLALIFDKLMPKKLKLKQPSPIGYFIEATNK